MAYRAPSGLAGAQGRPAADHRSATARPARNIAIAFDEEAYSLGLQGAAEYDTDIIRFSYSSMTTPTQLYDYNMVTRERTLLKTQEVPSGHNPDDYVTRRVFAPALDGEKVPVTLLYRKDTPLDGSAPCLLYGYGAYGITIPAGFNTNCLSLADRGFVYAIAHIRGGKDKGFAWYEDGKMDEEDQHLQGFHRRGRPSRSRQKFTVHDRIVAAGRLGRRHADGRHRQHGAGEIRRHHRRRALRRCAQHHARRHAAAHPAGMAGMGQSDRQQPNDYDHIAAYSPYDNVGAKAYPPILALAGLTDPRVTYWEPAKWVAKLREIKTDEDPVLFRTNMDAGHGGASGRFQRLEEVAYVYAYALKLVGKAGV